MCEILKNWSFYFPEKLPNMYENGDLIYILTVLIVVVSVY